MDHYILVNQLQKVQTSLNNLITTDPTVRANLSYVAARQVLDQLVNSLVREDN